jgi:hypothetical protein
MKDATHFIEAYKSFGKTGLIYGPIFEISCLKRTLNRTKEASRLKTIVVFFIKYKNQTP